MNLVVERVYFGKANKCCCGCSGNYHEVADPNSKGAVTRALKLVEKALKDPGAFDDVSDQRKNIFAQYVAVTRGNRCTIVYYAKKK